MPKTTAAVVTPNSSSSSIISSSSLPSKSKKEKAIAVDDKIPSSSASLNSSDVTPKKVTKGKAMKKISKMAIPASSSVEVEKNAPVASSTEEVSITSEADIETPKKGPKNAPRTPQRPSPRSKSITVSTKVIAAPSLLAPSSSSSSSVSAATLTGTSTPPRKSGFGGGLKTSTAEIIPRVDKIYRLIRKSTGALGGNGTTGAIYGELTMHSMQKVVNILMEKCDMNAQSRFIDVGSGLGKPNFHVAQDPAVRLSLGVELETIRWQLAMHNLSRILPEMEDNRTIIASSSTAIVSPTSSTPPPSSLLLLSSLSSSSSSNSNPKLYCNTNFIAADIDDASTTDPFTHIYMYDLGFPPSLQQSIALKFNNSVHAHTLVSYRPPHRVIHEYGYAVELVDQLSTSMHGSGENHTAYFYRRTNTPPSSPSLESVIVTIPGRPGMFESKRESSSGSGNASVRGESKNEKDIEVYCAPIFAKAIKLAVGELKVLDKHVREISNQHMTAERPKRDRRPPAALRA